MQRAKKTRNTVRQLSSGEQRQNNEAAINEAANNKAARAEIMPSYGLVLAIASCDEK
jgi:hypothetical protein